MQHYDNTLQAKAFFICLLNYDSLVANYFQQQIDGTDKFLALQRGNKLRYGENPHQQGVFIKIMKQMIALDLERFQTTRKSNFIQQLS